jgi:hypothetical protein
VRAIVRAFVSLSAYRLAHTHTHTLNLIRFSFNFFYFFFSLFWLFGAAAHTVPALISSPFLIIMVPMDGDAEKGRRNILNRILFDEFSEKYSRY